MSTTASPVHTVDDSNPDKLWADLSTPPPADKWANVEEVVVFQRYLDSGQCPAVERPHIESIIRDRIEMLREELYQSVAIFASIHDELARITRTLRVRIDFQSGGIICEQWVPAVDTWLVSGKWPPFTDNYLILADIKAGDPRLKTPAERFADNKRLAKANRRANEARSADAIANAIATLPSDHIASFLQVERALQTGEQINVRGADRRFVEKAVANTQSLARAGDAEARTALTLGRCVDTPALLRTHRRSRRPKI